jgi:hypothetical protein
LPLLYPPPVTVKLNTEEGYTINPVTGSKIIPIKNSYGDNMITGVPVPVEGKVIDPNIVAQALKVFVGKSTGDSLTKTPPEETMHPTVIVVKKESLKTFTPGKDTSSFVMVNSTGDTVPTTCTCKRRSWPHPATSACKGPPPADEREFHH